MKTTNTDSPHVSAIKVYRDSEFVVIDDSSRRNLEIAANLSDGSTNYKDFKVIFNGNITKQIIIKEMLPSKGEI